MALRQTLSSGTIDAKESMDENMALGGPLLEGFMDHLDKTVRPIKASIMVGIVMFAFAFAGGFYSLKNTLDATKEESANNNAQIIVITNTLSQIQKDSTASREAFSAEMDRMEQRERDRDDMFNKVFNKVFPN